MFASWLVLLAQTSKEDPLRRPEVIWGTAGIMAALLIGGAAIWITDRWRKRAARGARAALGSELTDFRGMLERGEITEDEYAKLRTKVAGKVAGKPIAREKPPDSPSPPDPNPEPPPPDPGNRPDSPPSA